MSKLGAGVARLALAYLFVDAGRNVFTHPDGPANPAARVTDRIKRAVPGLDGVPTTTFVRLNAVTHAVGGVGLLSRRTAAPAALVLAASLVPTSVAAFPFWSMDEGPQRTHARNDFTKNVGLMAGLVAIAASASTKGTSR
jgi:putative oxidoreductase